MGIGKLLPEEARGHRDDKGKKQTLRPHIIIATVPAASEPPALKQDGKKATYYREAMVLPEQLQEHGGGGQRGPYRLRSSPTSINAIGTKVTLVEFMPNIVPVEDEEVSKQLERSQEAGHHRDDEERGYQGDTKGKSFCKVTIKTAKGEEVVECDVVLSAVVATTTSGHRPGGGRHRHRQGRDRGGPHYATNILATTLATAPRARPLAHGPARGHHLRRRSPGSDPHPLDYGEHPRLHLLQPRGGQRGQDREAARTRAGDQGWASSRTAPVEGQGGRQHRTALNRSSTPSTASCSAPTWWD